jgi:hypothetical protein
MSSSHFTPDRFATRAPPNDDPEGGGTSHHMCASQSPADILIDGLIAYTFGPRASECYFGHLFKGQIRRSLLRWDVPGWPGACFTTQAVLNEAVETPTRHEHQSPARLLDYDVRNLQGTVVPQALWCPQGPSAMKKYVVDATLQWPVFFVRGDGTVGLPIHDAIERPCRILLGAQTCAPLGGSSTLHVRIQVRTG